MLDFPPRPQPGRLAGNPAVGADEPAVRAALARVARRTADWEFFSWYWGDAIAIDGQLAATAVLGDPAPRDNAARQLDRWAARCPAGLDDALAPGAAIASLVGDGTLGAAAAGRFLDAVDRLPLLGGVVPALEPHRQAYRFGVCIDAVYHLPSGLAALARLRDDRALARRAVRIAAEITQLTRCPDGWAQWHDFARRGNNAVAWSRGIGWALLGCLDTTALADGLAPADELAEVSAAMLTALAAAQQPDGHWPAVLGQRDTPAETSTAAFFAAAALHPQAAGLVPAGSGAEAEARAVERAVHACLAAVDADGGYQGVSADVLPSWAPGGYRRFTVELSPWGQGCALRALAAAAAG